MPLPRHPQDGTSSTDAVAVAEVVETRVKGDAEGTMTAGSAAVAPVPHTEPSAGVAVVKPTLDVRAVDGATETETETEATEVIEAAGVVLSGTDNGSSVVDVGAVDANPPGENASETDDVDPLVVTVPDVFGFD